MYIVYNSTLHKFKGLSGLNSFLKCQFLTLMIIGQCFSTAVFLATVASRGTSPGMPPPPHLERTSPVPVASSQRHSGGSVGLLSVRL